MVASPTVLRLPFLSPEGTLMVSSTRDGNSSSLPFPPFVSHLCSMAHKNCRRPSTASPGGRGHPYVIQHAAALLVDFLCQSFCRDSLHAPGTPLKCTIPGVRCSSFCIYLVQNGARGDTLSAVLCTSLELKLQCPGKGSFPPTF